MNNKNNLISRIEAFDAFDKNINNMQRHYRNHTKGVRPEVTGNVRYSNAEIHPNQGWDGDKAQFDILITRLTNNIPEDLDVAVFGFSPVESGYSGLALPTTGGTLDVGGGTSVGLPLNYNFTHTNGANIDTIQVSCNQLAYPSFLQSSAIDLYWIDNIRYSIDNAAVLDQFNNKFEFRVQSIFGKEEKNPLSVISFKKPENEQDTIIDIPIDVIMDKEKCIVMSISDTVAPFEVTLSCFVRRFSKLNAKSLRLGVDN